MAPWTMDYKPTPSDDPETSSSDEGLQPEKFRQYRKKPIGRRDLAFLIIPSVVSVSTVIALLILASTMATGKVPAAGSHGSEDMDHDHHSHEPINIGVTHCGHTAQEARSLGCLFDTVSFSWLPPNCYDQELFEDFSSIEGKFPFFYDPDGKSEAPWSEVEKGERAMYVPWSHHLWHCGWLWRKMHRAIMAGTPVDSYIGNYTHTEHCTQIMVEENRHHSLDDVNTIMALKFPYCGMGSEQWSGGTNFTRGA